MRVASLVFLLWATTSRAAIYENSIAVDDEEDINELEARGDISESTADTLLELIREGIDLNSASRDELYDLPSLTYAEVDAIIAYRKQKGAIEDPAELVGAEAITADQLLSIAPFIRLAPKPGALPISGRVRLNTRVTSADNVPPPAILAANLRGPFDLTGGVMIATTRKALLPVRYDSFVDTLVSDGFAYLPKLPRAYLKWQNGDRKVVIGTFTVGFAERLVLDTTRRNTPHGIYLTTDFRRPTQLAGTCRLSSPNPLTGECAGEQANVYVTPDYNWREPFRGIAGSIENISLGGEKSLSAYAFLSYQTRTLYQYELFDRRVCDDPRNDNDPACAAPKIFINEPPLTGDTKVIFSNLPALFDELTGGAHVEFNPTYNARIGVTGFGSLPLFHDTGPMQLDFQEWSRYPNGGAFGAIGIDGRLILQKVNLFLEAARNFDNSVGNNGGGWAIQQRTALSFKRQELDFTLRFYDDHYANPYARPVSGPDEIDGQRARDELGLRVRYSFKPNKDWELRARADLWTLPYTNVSLGPAGTTNLYGLVRGAFTGLPAFEPAIWVDVRNRNLASNVRGSCASGSIQYTEGTPFTCNGDFYKIAARLEFRPLSDRQRLQIIAQAFYTWRDDPKKVFREEMKFREDVQAMIEVRARPIDWLSLRARTRYLNEDISDNLYLEQSLWSYLEAAVTPSAAWRIAVRYDLFVWLDERAVTLNRVPSPEHRFMLDVRTSF